MPNTVADLLGPLAAGDEIAWANFVRDYTRFVRLKARMGYPMNEYDVDEITQETFLHVFRYAGYMMSKHPTWPIATMLATIARKKAIEKYRRESIRALHGAVSITERPKGEIQPLQPMDTRPSQHDRLLHHELLEMIPRQNLAIVKARFMDDMTLLEIAEPLSISQNTVLKRVRMSLVLARNRARKKPVASVANRNRQNRRAE